MPRPRIGFFPFTNSLPFTAPLLLRRVFCPWELVWGTPRALSQKMDAGQLDASWISSLAYSQSSDHFELIAPFTIAATSESLSVELRLDPQSIASDGWTLGLDPQSYTSNQIAQWWIPQHIDTSYHPHHAQGIEQLVRHGGYVIIGDACLETPVPATWKRWDLGKEFVRITQVPLPFGVIVSHRHGTANLWAHEILTECLEWSFRHLDVLVALAHSPRFKSRLSKEFLIAYWSTLSYTLEQDLQTSLDYLTQHIFAPTSTP